MAGKTTIAPGRKHGWVLYTGKSKHAEGDDPALLAGRRGDVVMAYPVSSLSTFLVTLPPVESSLLESMVFAQVEKRGLAGKISGETVFDFQKIDHSGEGDLYLVTVVIEMPEGLAMKTAAGFTSSAAVQEVGDQPVARIWKERGRYVLAIYREGEPVHAQVLSSKPELGNALAGEVNLSLLGLQGEAGLAHAFPESLEVALDDGEVEGFRAFSEAASLPVVKVASAIRARVVSRPRLTPDSVIAARRKSRNTVKTLIGLAVGLMIYLVVGAWFWKKAKSTEQEIVSLERQVEILRPDVERIELSEQRWKLLEPAFDKDYFPMIQLNRITSALPGSGVVVREFKTNGRSIRVRGQARDVQLANRLVEDLRAIDGFSAYEWSMPNPKVEKNNTATFEIEGKPKNAQPEQ